MVSGQPWHLDAETRNMRGCRLRSDQRLPAMWEQLVDSAVQMRRYRLRRQLQGHKLSVGPGSYCHTIASDSITPSSFQPSPAVNQVCVQPVAQCYRGDRRPALTAGLQYLGPKLRAVHPTRDSLRFHSVHLFVSWTLCLPAWWQDSR
jgi:hypothetical protein